MAILIDCEYDIFSGLMYQRLPNLLADSFTRKNCSVEQFSWIAAVANPLKSVSAQSYTASELSVRKGFPKI